MGAHLSANLSDIVDKMLGRKQTFEIKQPFNGLYWLLSLKYKHHIYYELKSDNHSNIEENKHF